MRNLYEQIGKKSTEITSLKFPKQSQHSNTNW